MLIISFLEGSISLLEDSAYSIIFDIAAWLMATVNVGEVQPKGEVTHLSDSDREPFFQSKTGAESFTSQDTMYSSASSPVQTVGAQSNYGATEH